MATSWAGTRYPDSWFTRWLLYRNATRRLWKLFPETLGIGFPGVAKQRRTTWREEWNATTHCVRSIASYMMRRHHGGPVDIRCDALIFYHHELANAKAPMLSLADELTSRGVRCLVLARDGLRLPPSGAAEEYDARALQQHYEQRMLLAHSRLRAWYIAARSCTATIAVIMALLLRGRVRLLDIGRNPLRLWLKLLRSAQRIDGFNALLPALRVKAIVVTHERFSPGSEMLLAPAAGHVESFHYHHGFSTVYEIPYLAGTVLVWNETDRKMLLELPGLKTAPPTVIVGNAELDCALASDSSQESEELLAGTSGRPVVVFLSQLVPEITHNIEGMRISLSWIHDAAVQIPQLHFLVKEHHPGDAIGEMMTQMGIRSIPNIAILPFHAARLTDLLNNPLVCAIASFSSTGLYLAAGAGKGAIRFMIDGMDEPIPLIDEVSVLAHDAAEFIDHLRGLLNGHTRCRENHAADLEDFFPHRGMAVRTIADIVEASVRAVAPKPVVSVPAGR
jgi:hypothetical protein